MKVALNMAMTVDGKVMRPDCRWYGLTSGRDRAQMDEYRCGSDILIVGKNSILRDNPNVVPVKGPTPIPVIICRNSFPPPDRNIFQQNVVQPILFVRSNLLESALDSKTESLLKKTCVVKLPEETFSPMSVFIHLREMGFASILLETGPAFNYQLFEQDLIDSVYITLVPFIIGRRDLPGILDGQDSLSDFDQKKWNLLKAQKIDDEVFLHYERRRG